MVNVHDYAHNLAKAIKDSEQYIKYMELKAVIKENESVKTMVEDFQTKQMQLQAAQMTGQEVSEEDMQKIQQLYTVLLTDPTAAEYMQAEMAFTQLMGDVSNILGDVLKIEE